MVEGLLHTARGEDTIVRKNTWQRVILLVVLGYEAAGGIVGGLLLIIEPDGRLMDMPVHIMHGVFVDFLVPGIILFSLSVFNAFAFVSVMRRAIDDWLMAGVAMGGFYIWFVVEIIILRELHWLHLMWGLPVLVAWITLIPLIAQRNENEVTNKTLIVCGIVSSLWYLAINILVPFFYEGYSLRTFTISELSAIGAPTRVLWVLLVSLYTLLFAAFGWGVLRLPNATRLLKLIGSLIVVYSLFNLYWPPMHMRGEVPALTDVLHITWATVTILLMIAIMGIGAAALDRRFRVYTIASLILLLLFGALTSIEAPNISTNGPTPTIGIWERINIGIFMLWVIIFSVNLLKEKRSSSGQIV